MKREVIRIPEVSQKQEKPIQLTHRQCNDGWEETLLKPSENEKIVYLGNCATHGDIFACYRLSGNIFICKGHLNSGKY